MMFDTLLRMVTGENCICFDSDGKKITEYDVAGLVASLVQGKKIVRLEMALMGERKTAAAALLDDGEEVYFLCT